VQERRRSVNPLPVDDNVAKARMFHLAQGVLVGLRGNLPKRFYAKLIDVAQWLYCHHLRWPRASGRRRRRDGGRRRRRSGHRTSMLGRSAGIDCLRTILNDVPSGGSTLVVGACASRGRWGGDGHSSQSGVADASCRTPSTGKYRRSTRIRVQFGSDLPWH